MEFTGSPVFGSTKRDISALVLPVVFAILVGSSIHFFYPTLEPHWYYPLMIVLFDTPHFFSGYWVMLTTPNKRPYIKKFIVFTFIFFLSFYLLLTQLNAYAWVFVMHAHFAAWHFVRQQQAFYQLSMSGSQPTKVGAWINKWGMQASTWGMFFISLCGEEAFGWYTPNDMIVFPAFIKPAAEWVVGSLVVLYILYHTYMAFKLKKFPLVGNLVWICGLVIYGCRVTGPGFLGGPLIIIPHAITYLYLLHRYAKAHGEKKWGISPALGVWVGYGLGFSYQLFYYFPRIARDENPMRSGWEISLILAIGTAHFMHDKLFWNSKNNPGWNENVLGPAKKEPVMTLKAS